MNIKKLIALDNPFRLLYHKIKAIIASFYYGNPSKDMIIIGITGTNGKTTTSNIIARGLKESGKKVFMFSTVNYFIGDEEYRNNFKMTSPNPFLLQKLLKQARSEGCEYAIIETSSHALLMNRVWGINYDVAVLTNITQDHLDIHHTMDKYARTKLSLFKKLISSPRKKLVKKTAIINIESDYKDLFLGETYDSLYTYGVLPEAGLKPIGIKYGFDYTTFKLDIPGGNMNIKTKLRGKFNVYNVLAGIGVLVSQGIRPNIIEKAILTIESVPGRFEEIKSNNGFKVFVDYAHTEDALRQVISVAKEIKGANKVITVFGSTGDRDKTKRPIMGKIVSDLSDVVILTQDDDYSEKTRNIINDILPGISRKEGEDFWVIEDREDAIRTALIKAEKDDIVLITGKGDEHSMVTNLGAIEWNDKAVIKKILGELDDNTIV